MNSVTAGTVSQKTYPKTAFDSILILTDKATFAEPFRVYQDSVGYLQDNTHADLIQAGLLAFAQEPKITTVIVAKTDATNVDVGALLADMVALDAVLDVDFFMVATVTDDTDAQLVELAKYIETKEMMGLFYTNNPLTIAVDATDLASLLKALGIRKSSVWYHATIRVDMAFASRFLGEKIGLVSSKHIVLSSVTASNLTSSEIANIEGKNCNYYDSERKKFTFTKQGITPSGENIKDVAGEIFVAVTCIEATYEVLLNNSNISFNTKDLKKLKSAITFKLRQAQDQEIIAEDDATLGASFIITVTPYRADNKIEYDIKYLVAGTVKWVTIKFTSYKDDTQFNIERSA